MPKTFVLHDCDEERAQMLKNEICKVRCWLTGFQAAGKVGIAGEDALRQMEIILDDSIFFKNRKKTGARK